MKTYVSGSALQRVEACPGSAALPSYGHTSEAADMGSAFHDHNRDRTIYTPGDAAARLPEHAARWGLDEKATSILVSRARAWEWQPPPGTLSEIPLGLFADGSVRPVKGGRGVYEGGPDLRVPATIDFFWAEPRPLLHPLEPGGPPRCPRDSLLWACDLKSGQDRYVAPVERNLQALAAAVLAGIYTGARYAVAAIVFPTPGQGTWDAYPAPLDAAGMRRGASLLLDIAERANREREAHRAGRSLRLVEGPHCTWCDSASHCPAKLATIKAYLSNPEPFAGAALTDAELTRLAELAPAFERFAASVKSVLKRAVRDRGLVPVPLSDGNVWGPHNVPQKELDTRVAFNAVKKIMGPEVAGQALKVEITGSSIEAAVKEAHERLGVERQVAPTMRAIYREIRAHDGIREYDEEWWGAYRPAPRLQAAEPVPAPLPAEMDGDLEDDDG